VGLFYTAPEPTRMVYPHWCSHISCRSSAGQGKFASRRPTFYHCATPPCTGNVKYVTITYSHKTDMPILSAHSKASLGQIALEPGTSFSFLSLIVGTAFSALTLLAGRHITVMLQRIGHTGTTDANLSAMSFASLRLSIIVEGRFVSKFRPP